MNVFEFKGPSDHAEEDDLELLVHVGTGLTYRFNEERRARGETRLENRQVSFWYLVPKLPEPFLATARARTFLDYQTGGLWRGSVWGHPVRLVAYRDVPVEEDTVPLYLVGPEPVAPRSLGELVVKHTELLERFAVFIRLYQPDLWEEIRLMASTSTDGPRIDWEKVGKYTNLEEVVPFIPLERIIQLVGPKQVIEQIGPKQIIEQLGLPRVIEASGEEKLLDELLKHLSPEQLQEMLRLRQQRE